MHKQVTNTLYKRATYTVAPLCLATFAFDGMAAALSPATPAGLPAHFESWIALAMILAAVMIAWLLNHAAPQARNAGTLFAALACFGVTGWFVAVLGTGILDNPKPFQTPMDGAKPALLWLQSSAAFIGGLALLAVAYRQRNNTEILILSNVNEPTRFGRVSRILHWTTAILFMTLIPMGIFSSMIPEDVWYRTEYNIAHKTIGFVVLGLFVARLAWNRASTRPALGTTLKPLERKLARFAHVALYVLMLAVPVTGYVMTSMHGYSSYFFAIELAPFIAESDAYKIWGLFHKYLLQYLVYLILGAHIIGALKHHYVDKSTNAFKRMMA